MSTYPPDNRLDGPIHGWFGLSYSNYQVLHRTLMQSMPVDWQHRMVMCLDELQEAYAHIEHADRYQVLPAVEREYDSLDDDDMRKLGVTGGQEVDGEVRFHDADGTEHESWERVTVPHGDDPIPHYNRGRTYVEPRMPNGATS